MDETTKQLMDVLTNQNSVLKETLFWSIGTIVTLITIFLTLNYFANRNFRKEEISRIQSEIELGLRNEFLHKFKEEISNEIEGKINQDIRNKSRDVVKHLEERLTGKEDKLLREINLLRASTYTLEGDFYTEKKNNSTALSYYLMAANHFLNNDYLINLGGILNKIEDSLKQIEKLDHWEKEEIQKVLNKLPESFKASKESIQKYII
ncbi:hypothetical protein FGG79_09775 [Bacillus sp. BHET2]|uniref:hypothetical protein n=1 Tax=Bacillus sp. BHET2 TaxID=2583818 RepID=UPI00110F3AFD|nr:hypothetical protein [Bacillus sp. BHET2]TMU85502.1 hypothetical protein FGG79_09775 [Bacillus sp. BHET2]